MIKACSLSSGSKGNVYYIKAGKNSFLVDLGISCKQIEERLKLVNDSPENISAVFITHEHSDHIRGLRVFLKKYNVPVYITKKTLENSRVYVRPHQVNLIGADDMIQIGNTQITSFSKYHDAADPCSFAFTHKGKKVSVITDVGQICENVINTIKNTNILFLESNYDEQMLEDGPYPYPLKKRIAGENGHLSNYNAGTLILEHATSTLKHIFLSHISENNNTPDLTFETFSTLIKERKDLANLNIHMTSMQEPSVCVKLD